MKIALIWWNIEILKIYLNEKKTMFPKKKKDTKNIFESEKLFVSEKTNDFEKINDKEKESDIEKIFVGICMHWKVVLLR